MTRARSAALIALTLPQQVRRPRDVDGDPWRLVLRPPARQRRDDCVAINAFPARGSAVAFIEKTPVLSQEEKDAIIEGRDAAGFRAAP
jgi:hypothetical protein